MVIGPQKRFAALTAGIAIAATAGVASLGEALAAQPADKEIWHQPAATDVMEYIEWFDYYTLLFLVPTVLLVLFLLVWLAVRFRASVNPEPSKTTHNTMIETVWTVVPILILVMLAIPSFDLLDKQLAPEEEPAMTVKVTGQRWYWSYEYQDDSELAFDSLMLAEEDREEAGKEDKGQYPRLLAVDYEMVVPVDTAVRVLVTAQTEDVIHSFALPAFGVKVDAIPGRMNETWFKVREEGLYYGQCSELCGKDHAFMPIAIRVVSKDKYDAWKAAATDDIDAANQQLMAAIESDKATKVADAGNATTQAVQE